MKSLEFSARYNPCFNLGGRVLFLWAITLAGPLAGCGCIEVLHSWSQGFPMLLFWLMGKRWAWAYLRVLCVNCCTSSLAGVSGSISLWTYSLTCLWLKPRLISCYRSCVVYSRIMSIIIAQLEVERFLSAAWCLVFGVLEYVAFPGFSSAFRSNSVFI